MAIKKHNRDVRSSHDRGYHSLPCHPRGLFVFINRMIATDAHPSDPIGAF